MTANDADPGPDVARTLGLDRSSTRRRRLRRALAAATVAAAAAVAAYAWAAADGEAGPRFRTAEVSRGDLAVAVTATGNLEPTNQVDVGIEVSGTIADVEADYNDRVKVGQVLARLDTSKLNAQVLQSRAGLDLAKARVLQAQATVKESRSALDRLRRVRELSGGKVPSQNELDAGEAALARALADQASAEAQVAEAAAILEVNETDLAKAVIYSPIDGIVLARNVAPGQTVAASFQTPVLFTIAEDLTKMELHVDVDEADVGQVREGQAVTFGVDAYPGRRFPARITQVRYGAQEVGGVITYEAVLDVDNSDLSLRPGMTATADIEVKSVDGALLLPNAALRFTPPLREEPGAEQSSSLLGRLFRHPSRSHPRRREVAEADPHRTEVWVLREGRLVAVPIVTGATNGIETEIVSGDVREGTQVVTATVGAANGA